MRGRNNNKNMKKKKTAPSAASCPHVQSVATALNCSPLAAPSPPSHARGRASSEAPHLQDRPSGGALSVDSLAILEVLQAMPSRGA